MSDTPNPTPPASANLIATVVEIGHKARDAVALDLKRVHLTYHIVGVAFIIAVVLGGVGAWRWHVGKLARLELRADSLATRAGNAEAIAATFRAQAAPHVAAVRVETLTVNRIIYRTPTYSAPIPVAQPDGSTSMVPMPVVLAVDFDTLGRTCSRLAHDCGAALALKDSAAARDSVVIASLYELNHNTTQRLGMANRAKFWSKILYGAGGASVGYSMGRLSCPR